MADAEFLRRLGLFVEPAFLDSASCAKYRSEMERSEGKLATVSARAGDEVDESYRKTKQAEVSDEIADDVRARLLALKPALEAHFDVALETLEKLHFLVYREGDFFRAHADSSDEEDVADAVKQRQVSLVAFLNDERSERAPGCFGGGQLTFYGLLGDEEAESPIGVPVDGRTGQLVAFPARVLHGVGPVTHGQRFTIVSWFR